MQTFYAWGDTDGMWEERKHFSQLDALCTSPCDFEHGHVEAHLDV